MSKSPRLLPLPHVKVVGAAAVSHLAPATDKSWPALEAQVHGLIWFQSGPERITASIEGRTLSLLRGSLVLIRPGQTFALANPGTTAAVLVMIFCAVQVPPTWPDPDGWPQALSELGDASLLPPLLRFCLRVAAMPEPMRTDLLAGVIPLLLQMFVSGIHEPQQTAAQSTLPSTLARAVSSLVQDQSSARLTPTALATQAGISTNHLAHLTKEHLGIPPRRLLLLQRLAESTRLLADTSLSLKEIAYRCGFSNPPYFTRQFARELGCTPSEYRSKAPDRRPQLNTPRILASQQISSPASYASIDLFRRCNGEATPEQLAAFLQDDLRRESRPFKGIRARPQDWNPLPLHALINRSRNPGSNSWLGFPLHLAQLPSGEQTFHGIGFQILDEAVHGGQSVLVMRSAKLRSAALPTQVQTPVGQRVGMVAVLHACGWAASLRQQFGEYLAEYEDGTFASIPLWSAGDPPALDRGPLPLLQDWWPTAPQFDHATARKLTLFDPANPLGTIRYLYTYLWRNPRPEIALKAWHIRTTGQQQATLAVVAISVLPWVGAVRTIRHRQPGRRQR